MKYGEHGHMDYSKLWALMERVRINKLYLRQHGIHPNTLGKLVRNENITTEVVCRLCQILQCQPGDIMEYKAED